MIKKIHGFSKSIWLVLLVGITTTAWADLPDPQSCGKSFPNVVTINYQGTSFGSPKTYTFALHFYKPGEFTYSDSGQGVEHETIDGSQLRDTANAGFFSSTNLTCSDRTQIQNCSESVSDVMNTLNSIEGKAQSPQSTAALACATSISLSFMMKSMQISDGLVQVQPGTLFRMDKLNSGQVAAVNNRMIALKTQENAQEAADAATQAQITSSMNYINSTSNSANHSSDDDSP